MLRANTAKVDWDPSKKQWHLQIHVGAEVIKRYLPKVPQTADDATLLAETITTARDEGYELDAAQVEIVH